MVHGLNMNILSVDERRSHALDVVGRPAGDVWMNRRFSKLGGSLVSTLVRRTSTWNELNSIPDLLR